MRPRLVRRFDRQWTADDGDISFVAIRRKPMAGLLPFEHFLAHESPSPSRVMGLRHLRRHAGDADGERARPSASACKLRLAISGCAFCIGRFLWRTLFLCYIS